MAARAAGPQTLAPSANGPPTLAPVRDAPQLVVMGEEKNIEAVAVIAAQLAEPFARRVAVLSTHALNEAHWDVLQSQWRDEVARRAATGDKRLLLRFRRAFAAEAQRLREAAKAASLSTQRQRAEPATRYEVLNSTSLATPVLEPALPFSHGDGPGLPTRESAPTAPAAKGEEALAGAEASSPDVGRTVMLESLDVESLGLPFDNDKTKY